ncbi:DUF2330 domain-containing protein [Streptomyces sp. NPDC058469]|uniref:DUF2330 domain-containing protein n=1 Tax=Streptomyces sp. NPDC058469 TaxID=3346514 RepID=UPI0036506DF1
MWARSVHPRLTAGAGTRACDGREASVVRRGGRQEQIVTRLTVSGDARRAAWIMPVSHRATAALGDWLHTNGFVLPPPTRAPDS